MTESRKSNQMSTKKDITKPKIHCTIIALIMLIFFVISFITNILNSIIVDVKTSFDLSLTLTGLLTFSFFIANGVMSIPGGFISLMWSDIFSLALNSLSNDHGSLSGILCTGIAGAAIIPFLVGWIGEMTSMKTGIFFLLIPMGFMLSIGFWASPLVNNKIISLKKSNL
jgi:fucose permease